jgi:hypothetical protein
LSASQSETCMFPSFVPLAGLGLITFACFFTIISEPGRFRSALPVIAASSVAVAWKSAWFAFVFFQLAGFFSQGPHLSLSSLQIVFQACNCVCYFLYYCFRLLPSLWDCLWMFLKNRLFYSKLVIDAAWLNSWFNCSSTFCSCVVMSSLWSVTFTSLLNTLEHAAANLLWASFQEDWAPISCRNILIYACWDNSFDRKVTNRRESYYSKNNGTNQQLNYSKRTEQNSFEPPWLTGYWRNLETTWLHTTQLANC